MTIERHDDGKHGYAKATDGNTEAGRMTYTWAGTDKIIIDHTEVNPDFSGGGVGKKMLMHLVEWAREDNIRIKPLCPFAKAMFERDKTIGDVLY